MVEGAPDPTRIVADADVLAADLLVGGPAREALGTIRAHSWLELVASDRLIAETAAIITSLTDERLAEDWRSCIERERVSVDQPAADHPALASAYQGNAAQLLSFDESLTGVAANRSIRTHLSLSIRTPGAFLTVFDPAAVYETQFDEEYPGPDR